MKRDYGTEQERFWAGAFGDEYTDRIRGGDLVARNIALFAKILEGIGVIRSVIEFGANLGLNLVAIRALLPDAELAAVEINRKAAEQLETLGDVRVYHQSILNFSPDGPRDLVLVKGVLIHVGPDQLSRVYDLLYRTSGRYICLVEYYNPTPVEVPYRGHERKLFKRDFAGEMLDRFDELRLVRYGFVYHRDPGFPQDDVTWFLLEKTRG